VILIDTSGLLAALFPDQRRHKECAEALRSAEPPRIISPFVLAELDYLVLKYAGVEVELMLLEEVRRGVYDLVDVGSYEMADVQAVIKKYASLRVGLADAATVVLAEQYKTRNILTLDERHFRAMKTASRKSFRILPADT
jgi:predicted nucleic acid-binding protein